MKKLALLLLLLSLGCSNRQTVVVYSPHGADVLRDYEKLFESAHPDIDLQWLDMGSKDVYSRVSAERGRPLCDVWWGAPSTMFAQAAKEGLLEAYRPSWADKIDASFKDAQDRWYATSLLPLAILFNTRKYTREDMPATWDALLGPKWDQRIALRKPLPSGTMRTFISAMITRAQSEDEGIAWLKKLHQATATYPESPNLLFDHLKKNEDRISIWLMPDIIMQRVRNDFPFGYAVLPNTPVLTDCIAIVKNAPHPELAKRFYEFATTPDALVHQAQHYAKLPARNDIDRAQLPPKLIEQNIDAMPLDWDEIAANEEAWCARWEKEVYNAP